MIINQVVIFSSGKVYQGGSGFCVYTDISHQDAAQRTYSKAVCICMCEQINSHQLHV